MSDKTTVVIALRRLSEVQDDLLVLDGVTGVGVGGTENDAKLQVFSDGELAPETVAEIDALAGDVPWNSVSMSRPTASPSEEE